MVRWRSVVVALAFGVPAIVGGAACGGDDGDDKADGKPVPGEPAVPQTTMPVPTVSTGESIVGSTVTTVAPTTTVTVAMGLPTDGLGIPAAGQLILGPSSSLSNAITVRGVPLEEVVAYVREQLAALGWTVHPDLTFTGPGATGQATVAQVGEDVEIQLVLSGSPE